jgi:hypothetical protein
VSGKNGDDLEDARVIVRLSDAVANLLQHTAFDPHLQIVADEP